MSFFLLNLKIKIMKIEELISKLQKFNLDAEVMIIIKNIPTNLKIDGWNNSGGGDSNFFGEESKKTATVVYLSEDIENNEL